MTDGERNDLIEKCAKIVDPWPGFPTTEPNWCGWKLTEIDKAVIKFRQDAAATIRSLAVSK